ncbi:MAG TPA: long-chain-acyl-CoA synthetase [Gordonia sp. (in: high G+C Gram-positive bacteria)]|uniref:long-chain-acyl-CoA synthetase n=1 Tax=unclassified Gordonia (in: high G+C Gram-positive bacteria) TaxID=2657482 RepID=UPI000FC0D26F|nr:MULTISPECIES: long-chain-acyl-CoA synthetase [unclassified Gordonia (in: high G+C Gram-positive bacteria)]RUP36804.1 MAG: long-chain-acyl-CoA synthetase [Gordonia sp. (in: high G+C Gram-positive bacteria)]HNP58644.1 long-chain-acyl-CoA synthetase [Gordonia sp. (in: high G+C Gram-positive bacteria)]HRC52815.1 long-chain-acyl-CoA synthetase [Gordonia sp. (in: high G+C Gram-positive bacteria)]
MSKGAATKKVRLTDLAKGVVDMIPSAPLMLRHAPGLIHRPADAKKTIGSVFQGHAGAHPERPFVRFEGATTTYGEANTIVNRYAAQLAADGVGVGDVVALLGKNSPTLLYLTLATVKIGATAGMMNYNQQGEIADHSMTLLGAKVLVRDPDCAPTFESMSASVLPPHVYDYAEFDAASAGRSAMNPAVTATLPASTNAFYIFTSGTTGLPKASVMSHNRWLANMAGIGGMAVRLRHSDTMYIPLPLYHNNALSVSLGSVLAAGASVAIAKQFSASRFWDDIILNRATAFCYIGELCRYLLAQPPKPTDRSHGVRLAVGNGMRPEIWDEFSERFGIKRIVEFYGASELNLAFVNVFTVEKTAGFCPLPFKVVEYDQETGEARRDAKGRLRSVRKGEPGLLISEISSRVPLDGYTDSAATEKKIIRDGFKDGDSWFNSGDLVREVGWGHIAFVDRLGDTFRWKGENVATTEVERALVGHDGVDEAVVYGVAVPGTDGKAGMAAVTLAEGVAFDGKGLAEHLYSTLPAYAVPLFVRIIGAVEATSTFKNRKVELRDEGYGEVGSDPLYVFAGRSGGYVESYDDYAADVAAARAPRG